MMGASSGQNIGDAALTGIPFLGEGFAAQQQNNFAAAQSAQQMAFQKEMSNTAHQREAADLEKAGLNRILSLGSGASSPSGAAASGAMGSGAGSSAKLLGDIYRGEKEKNSATVANMQAGTNLTKEKSATEKINQVAGANSAKESEQRTKESAAREKNLQLQQEGLKQDAAFEKEHGATLRKSNAILNSAQKVRDVLNPFKGIFNQGSKSGKTKRTTIDARTGEVLNESMY